MKVAITQVLDKEQIRHSFAIDCSQMPKSLARNLELVVERTKFFDLPRVMREERESLRGDRLKLSITRGGQHHTIHGEYFAFPEQLHYLVRQSFDFFLRNSQGSDRATAEAFKVAQDLHNHQAVVDAYAKVYGKWSPTLYYNPHLTFRYAQFIATWVEHEDYFDDRPEFKAKANKAAVEKLADLVEEEPLFLEVSKELAIVLRQATPEDLAGDEFKEIQARVTTHMAYLKMEYPQE